MAQVGSEYFTRTFVLYCLTSTSFDTAIMLDDSWSVGAIDFKRQIQITKFVLGALNPDCQKSMVWLYRHGEMT